MQKYLWIILILLALFGVYFRVALYEELKAWRLVPLPETYTELYFVDPLKLPTAAKAGKPLSFAFVIQNHEGKEMEYPYRVYLSSQGSEILLEASTTKIADGQLQIIPERYVPPYTMAQTQVRVILVGRTERIDFLLK